ncbi:SOS response-associated peptidase family protein [Nitrosovibrio sp. Nv4]|uniref:SOS response-associated peptidase family protein n=1 Tax=Nitrosovibrio sp. Nv4 TaxID=1945880 RepID=UPI000BE2F56B|nr:SOS response-associated peptidase family protein [Nitrosovibrio sp. Nv4]
MCGRFEQSGTRKHYARALGADMSNDLDWTGGDHIAMYNIAPGLCPWMIMLHDRRLDFIGHTWGYRTPEEAAAKKKPWINARIEKALTGRYFRHMFREGRVIIPGGGWFEWTLENGQKQPRYIKRKDVEPIFMAGITNFKPYIQQNVEVGFVIVTEDSGGGMVDIHDRRPVVLAPEDAWRWLDVDTPVEEAAHIAQSRSLPSDAFTWVEGG